MRKFLWFISISVLLGIQFSCKSDKKSGKPRVLVFSKTTGYRHASISNGVAAIQKLGQENNFDVDTTENADWFSEEKLKTYSTVIFLHTTGDLLNNRQETDFERYIQAGGGFLGIHAAADAEYDWGWYGKLVGAWFESHPKIQEAKIIVTDKTHASTKHLPGEWIRTDEWYNFKNINKDVHVLLSIDEKSYEGGKNGDNHPMAWYHDYDGGRAYYTELGHTPESWSEENYLKHVLGGIQFAIGDNKELNYSKVHSEQAPPEEQFTKTVLTQGEFTEPTEMTILPNLDILVVQRRGEILLYKNDTKKIKQVGLLNVYWKTTHTPGVNAEEGLLGICKDPDFAKNNWIYIFYSPADTSVNRLSRFELKNDSIDLKSEKVILQFYSQREICCHTGGSISFGPGGLLYVSTGDNSTPFDEPKQKFASNGFAPLDDRPGHQQYDARRSAGNTNDLRGKIIRIKVNEDGSYSIPDGNLFSNQPNTKPEIYAMGARNPYRISVDQKNGYVYWGEVGPDSDTTIATRGPKGYDEFNQAKKPGFFGWPLIIGNNYPYHEYDYSKGKPGILLDPAKPVNNSINNTGLKELPPAQPALIWYPYGRSQEFPQLKSGGRTAMAGPVFYSDMFPESTRLPDYYNGKLFIYEFMRNWIKVVSFTDDGNFYKMEPFMEHIKLAAPMDMELGPDGKLYILEYGKGWFVKNPDAALSRIDYKK